MMIGGLGPAPALAVARSSFEHHQILLHLQAGLALLLPKFQGVVDLPRFCQQSETPFEPAVERPGLWRLGSNGNVD